MKRAGALRIRWFLAIGSLVAALVLVAPTRGERRALYVLSAVALLWATDVSRRRKHLTWTVVLVITATVACYATAQFFDAATSRSGMFAHGVLYLLGTLGGVTTFAIVVRQRPPVKPGATIADGLVLALGAWSINWIVFVQPLSSVRNHHGATSVVDGLMGPTTATMLFLVGLVVFTRIRPRLALMMLAGATAVDVGGHTVSALVEAGHLTSGFDRIATVLHVAAYFTAGGALMHWSAADILTPSTQFPLERRIGRLVVTTSSLVVPAVVVAATMPRNNTDRLVQFISIVVLGCAATVRVVMSARDNSEVQEELLRNAQTDGLTGLPNRTLLLLKIHECLGSTWNHDRLPALYFVDLDRFKNINDSLGHAAGDELLVMVAQRLRSAVPADATVARLSGDEYVVLEPGARSAAAAMALADRLLDVFREPVALSQGDVFITASIGMAYISPRSSSTPDDLLRHADTAMYRAKDAGRNCVALYDESMHERASHRLSVETALYRAIDRGELQLFHQPILDLDTGEVEGFEALLRWHRDGGAIVSPAEFIPIAEDTGTINAIGSWALLEALNQLRRWIDDGVCSSSATMSVNVSPRQLADPELPSIVAEALARSRVSAHQLWLEVTEGIMIAEPELALATLRRLRSLGVRVALDDFGTGYSSLSLLQRFPLQRIKIDRGFVHGVADNPNDRSLVRTIVAMGRSLGLDIVAEGVETIQQLQVLSDLGCKKVQGFLVSHPVPADAMRSTVAALERLGSFPGLRPTPSSKPATNVV
ncbi:MAG: bifunctional diguanylate cyclase/phosphodiesterase [Ilumatobacteraceae bacterium]